jgi:hypothetical protein
MLVVDQESIQSDRSLLPEAGSAILNPAHWFPKIHQLEQLQI